MEVMRILLADDHILFREGLASLISSRPDLTIVGEAKDGVEAINLARETRPDVILMDVHMPNLDGWEAVKILKEEMPDVAVVMLAMPDDDALFQAIKNGAKGYLLKSMELEELYLMLDKIHLGEAAISGAMVTQILREVMASSSNETKQQGRVDELTARKIEVLEEVAKGVYKEIGDTLNISEGTVKMHLRNILEKLPFENRLQVEVRTGRNRFVNDASDLYQ